MATVFTIQTLSRESSELQDIEIRISIKKLNPKAGHTVRHSLIPSTQKAKAGGSLRCRSGRDIQRNPVLKKVASSSLLLLDYCEYLCIYTYKYI